MSDDKNLTIDGYKSEIIVITGDLDTEYLLITRSPRGDMCLPGGFFEAERPDALAEALRELDLDRMITFDTSGSMPDDMIRAMTREVETLVRDHRRIEICQRADAMLAEPVDLPYLPRKFDNGAPRSIKETRRAQGRGRRASAMSGWKRK